MRRIWHISGCLALSVTSFFAWDARGETVMAATVQYGLEKFVSGATAKVDLGQTSVSVTPIRTWKSVSGHWCRRYELLVTAPGTKPNRSEATRCRQDGVWMLARE